MFIAGTGTESKRTDSGTGTVNNMKNQNRN